MASLLPCGASQVHKRVIDWDEVPFLTEWRRQLVIWRQRENERRTKERHDSAARLQAWARGMQVRNKPPTMTIQAKSLADAVADFFRNDAPIVELPPSKSLDEAVDELFPPAPGDRARGSQLERRWSGRRLSGGELTPDAADDDGRGDGGGLGPLNSIFSGVAAAIGRLGKGEELDRSAASSLAGSQQSSAVPSAESSPEGSRRVRRGRRPERDEWTE